MNAPGVEMEHNVQKSGTAMNVGFVGLGNMGAPIARNLVKAGHRVKVYDTNADRMHALVSNGAASVKSEREVAAESDVVFLSLPTHLVVREVVLGSGQLLVAMKSGSTLVDLSTSMPAIAEEIAREAERHSVEVVDAPVSGGVEGAAAGKLSILIGGKQSVVEKLWPLLEVIADPKKIFHMGGVGTGHSMKLIHGLINAATLVGVSEALVVGRKAGIDPQKMFDVISASRGNSGIFQSRAPRMLDGNFDAAFAIDLKYKDMTLGIDLAQQLKIPVFVSESARAVFQVARAKGLGNADIAAVITVLEDWAGTTVRRSKK